MLDSVGSLRFYVVDDDMAPCVVALDGGCVFFAVRKTGDYLCPDVVGGGNACSSPGPTGGRGAWQGRLELRP